VHFKGREGTYFTIDGTMIFFVGKNVEFTFNKNVDFQVFGKDKIFFFPYAGLCRRVEVAEKKSLVLAFIYNWNF
jgi:hypothetical protein